MTERLHFHFSLSYIGEGNGNPLQYSCLESPRDRGAYWAAVYGVSQSRTQLKRLSSSSSMMLEYLDEDMVCVLEKERAQIVSLPKTILSDNGRLYFLSNIMS